MEPTDSHRISAAPELGSDDTPDEALVGMKTPKLSAENKRMIRGNLMCVLFEQVDADPTVDAYAHLIEACGPGGPALFAANKAFLVRNLECREASGSSRIAKELYHLTVAFLESSNDDLLALKFLVLLGYLCIDAKDRDGYDAVTSQIRELVRSNDVSALPNPGLQVGRPFTTEAESGGCHLELNLLEFCACQALGKPSSHENYFLEKVIRWQKTETPLNDFTTAVLAEHDGLMQCRQARYRDAFKQFRTAFDAYGLFKSPKALAMWKCLRLLAVITSGEELPPEDAAFRCVEEISKTSDMAEKLETLGLCSISELTNTPEYDVVWHGIDRFREMFTTSCRRLSSFYSMSDDDWLNVIQFTEGYDLPSIQASNAVFHRAVGSRREWLPRPVIVVANIACRPQVNELGLMEAYCMAQWSTNRRTKDETEPFTLPSKPMLATTDGERQGPRIVRRGGRYFRGGCELWSIEGFHQAISGHLRTLFKHCCIRELTLEISHDVPYFGFVLDSIEGVEYLKVNNVGGGTFLGHFAWNIFPNLRNCAIFQFSDEAMAGQVNDAFIRQCISNGVLQLQLPYVVNGGASFQVSEQAIIDFAFEQAVKARQGPRILRGSRLSVTERFILSLVEAHEQSTLVDRISIELFCSESDAQDIAGLQRHRLAEAEADALIAPNSTLQKRLREVERLSRLVRHHQQVAHQPPNNPPIAVQAPPQPFVNGNAAAVPLPFMQPPPGAFFGNFHAHAAPPRPTCYLIPGDSSQLLVVLMGDFIGIRRAPKGDEKFFTAAWPYS
ncbi:hypothetical protein AAVH_21914 [Aphelenchoides avenae]|nr:hypothetical protein AAVH_21914 [Aphelenchus avenae]